MKRRHCNVRGTWHWGCGVAAIVLAALTLTLPARANESAMEFFEPVVTHRQFTDFIRPLDLDHQQRMVVEFVFSDYTDAIAALAKQANGEADAVGRQTIIEAYSGRRLVDPAELRRLRVAVLEAYRAYLPRVDQQLHDLITGVRSMLTSEQAERIEPPLRQLRRAIFLHPLQVGQRSFEYAGDGVDLLQLIDDATRDGGELHGLDQQLASVRRSYEQQLDELLVQNANDHRSVRTQLRLARIQRDQDALQRAEQQALDLWRQLYELNARTARSIGEIAVRHGEQAQQRWQQRFQHACFPWMFTTSSTDRQYEWVMRQQLTDEQRAQAEQVYKTFQSRQEELRNAAIDMMLTARIEMQIIVYAMMDQTELANPVAMSLHQRLLRNTGELASAEAAATAGFESLLSDNQRAAMRRAMRR